MCDIFNDGISAEEMGLILGITDEIEEESKTPLAEEQLSFEDTVSTKDEMLDEN